MIQLSQVDLIRIAMQEMWRQRNVTLLLFVFIALLSLAIGWFWPKEYMASATILVDDQNILEPLMEGTAVATSVADQAKNAKLLLSGREAKEKIFVLLADDLEALSREDKERFWDKFIAKTSIESVGNNLIRIKFKSNDALNSKQVVDFYTDYFINVSKNNKREESESAYVFISNQAGIYHKKLLKSEEAIKEFRTKNLGAIPNTMATVNSRILELERFIDETELQVTETKIQIKNTEAQLSGEARVSAHLNAEGHLEERVRTMQEQLDALRMTYKDSYPDIVILKDQIASLQEQILNVDKTRAGHIGKLGHSNPLFQELRQQYSQFSITLAALKSRLKAQRNLLEEEKVRAIKINNAEALLSQLVRDFDANDKIYQRLLDQRENARISMHIDIENQGLTLRIQEAAAIPLIPVGVRLMHIAVLGIMMAVAIPFGLSYTRIQFDEKIRSPLLLQHSTGIPVLGSIPEYKNKQSAIKQAGWLTYAVMTVFAVLSAYGYVGWLRLMATGGAL
ncbi:MAG: hypothetical protein HRU20_28760 [Pseudomonadales bacterium]|nr:hypothetical protein [Pseudomonadales bacterium]